MVVQAGSLADLGDLDPVRYGDVALVDSSPSLGEAAPGRVARVTRAQHVPHTGNYFVFFRSPYRESERDPEAT